RSLGSNAETLNREQSIGALQLKMHVLSLNDSIPHFNPDRLLGSPSFSRNPCCLSKLPNLTADTPNS
ncbi:MAG: hypothetical protein KME30_11075, partial [Iphinoe sp. HA4291-MV1]|nr:hypothetical protein [Iphinoe sp. HA4291-MV1]